MVAARRVRTAAVMTCAAALIAFGFNFLLIPHRLLSGGVSGVSGVLFVALSLVLAGYFVWHAWTCTERTRVPAADPEPTVAVRTRTATRVAPVAHAVMSAALAAMFLGAV